MRQGQVGRAGNKCAGQCVCACVDGGVPGAYALGTATSEREIAMASGEDVFSCSAEAMGDGGIAASWERLGEGNSSARQVKQAAPWIEHRAVQL